MGYQQSRGLLALGSGGLFGQGLFQGIQTQGGEGSLPARQTDFIFCVCEKRDPNPRIRRLSRNQAICRASSAVKVRRTISAG